MADDEDDDSFIVPIVLHIVVADSATFDVDVDDNENENVCNDDDDGGGGIKRAYTQVLYIASINIVTVKRWIYV